eukprot:s754_g19.t1
MSLQKHRLTADPCLGVGDIMSPVVSWLKEEGKYDLSSLLEPKTSVTWKTAPNLEWLCSLEKLFEKLLKVAPACILPSKKVRVALQKIQTEVARINFSRKDDETFFDRMDLLLRIAASQLRDLKQQLVVYQRTMKKASVREKEKIDGLLMLINLPGNEVEADPQKKPEPLKQPCTALVPYVAPKSPKTTKTTRPQSPNSSRNIFSRILSKKLSDDATSSGPSSSSRSLKREVAWDDFNRSEMDMLAEALSKDCHLCLSHVQGKGKTKKGEGPQGAEEFLGQATLWCQEVVKAAPEEATRPSWVPKGKGQGSKEEQPDVAKPDVKAPPPSFTPPPTPEEIAQFQQKKPPVKPPPVVKPLVWKPSSSSSQHEFLGSLIAAKVLQSINL